MAVRLADSIPDKRGRGGIQAGGSLFQSFYLSQRWLPWAFPGAALILSVTWYKVELDVKINDWFGDFYNLIQKALSRTNTITMDEYMGLLATFGQIAGLYVTVAVFTDFSSSITCSAGARP